MQTHDSLCTALIAQHVTLLSLSNTRVLKKETMEPFRHRSDSKNPLTAEQQSWNVTYE